MKKSRGRCAQVSSCIVYYFTKRQLEIHLTRSRGRANAELIVDRLIAQESLPDFDDRVGIVGIATTGIGARSFSGAA